MREPITGPLDNENYVAPSTPRPYSKSVVTDESIDASNGGSVSSVRTFVSGLNAKEWVFIILLMIVAGVVGYDASVRSDANRSDTLLRNHVDHLSNQVEVETMLVQKLTECKR